MILPRSVSCMFIPVLSTSYLVAVARYCNQHVTPGCNSPAGHSDTGTYLTTTERQYRYVATPLRTSLNADD